MEHNITITENWEVRAVPRLCELYPGICLTTEEKARIILRARTKNLKTFLLLLTKFVFKVSFHVQVLASFRKIPLLKHVRYSRIISTKSPSFGVTNFSASLWNITAFKHHSRDSSCYVSRMKLAPPRLPKHGDLRAQEFAHCPVLWHQPRLVKFTAPGARETSWTYSYYRAVISFMSKIHFFWLCPIIQPQIPNYRYIFKGFHELFMTLLSLANSYALNS
jgi:hypothetical protein